MKARVSWGARPMLRFTTTSVVLIGLALTANAEEPLAFKGFRIGADRAAFLANFPGSDCTVDECRWRHERLCPPDYDRCFTHERWKYGPTRPLSAVAQFRGD